MRLLFLFLMLFQIKLAEGQIIIGKMDEQDRMYSQTLKEFADFLKSHQTDTIALHESAIYSEQEKFYDTVINRFFSKEKMLSNLSKETELNAADFALDIIPFDSLNVQPSHYTIGGVMDTLSEEYDYINNSLGVFIVTEGKSIELITCYFDKVNARLLGLIPLGRSAEDAVLLQQFLELQKRRKVVEKLKYKIAGKLQ